jgi:hypothetical protein
MMEVIHHSETLVPTGATLHNIPEYCILIFIYWSHVRRLILYSICVKLIEQIHGMFIISDHTHVLSLKIYIYLEMSH